ncbi:MAG: tetratricopeptide repeat protein, partial [Cyanobacteria bacterium HKST-UBA02]|nr:tetratricopeptide repeat protein [Cyanobacteria bacterium HKST-UBA02]
MSKVFVIAVAWIIFLPSPAYSIETSRALLERASADLDAGKIDSSLALAERCIKLYPRCAGAFLIKARCLEVNNNIEGALQSVRAAARMDKNLPEVYKHYGSIACEAGKYNEGIEALSAAIKLYPQTKSYYHYRSMAYGAIKRYDLAIKDLDEYLKLGPEKSVGWFWRGAAYEQVGNTARAIKDYSMAVKLKPQSADFLVARAKAYEKLGKLDLALKDMTRASKIDFM